MKKTALALALALALPSVSTGHALTAAYAEREDIGTWVVTYGIRITTTLYTQDGQPFMRQRFDDGSTLTERLTKRGDRYHLPGGEWFIIASNGNLNLYDADGLIWSARPQ